MIFNQISETRGDLLVRKWDYGVPVIFLAGKEEGFSIDEKIVFTFKNDIIPDKDFIVNKNDYSFELSLSKEEADTLANANRSMFAYSIKHYSKDGVFLDTLIDGWLKIQDTLRWSPSENEVTSNG